MRRLPFDEHRLEAVFQILGFDRGEILLHVHPEAANSIAREIKIPQWNISGVKMSVRDRPIPYAGSLEISSAFIVSVDMQRESFYLIRLVIMPLVMIVLLSFSVFWMDKSSLGDRLSVSFIGILTGVAYQIVLSDQLPSISYFTLIHGFLNLSFFVMCTTVIINLVVGALDQQGKTVLADRIDRRCRWIFPLTYFGLIFVMFLVAIVFF